MNENNRDEVALGLMAEAVDPSGRFRPLSMLSLVRMQQLGCGVYGLVMFGEPLPADDGRAFLEYAWVHAAPEADVAAALRGGRAAGAAAVDAWAAEQDAALLLAAGLEVRRQVERCVAMMAEVVEDVGGGSKNVPGQRC